VHVDGGVLNNMPTDLIRADGAGFVVGVDVAPGALEAAPDVPMSAVVGAESKQPNLLELLTRVGSIGDEARATARRKHCDVLVLPRLSNVGLLSFGAYERAIDAGYRSAVEKMDQITRKIDADSPEVPVTLQL
jgi:NTE family protein